jgi:hypothetical protein
MGPFKRKREPSSGERADVRVRETAYRRLGHAMATVVVTLDARPPTGARLTIRGESASVSADPMMATHEAPGTKAEAHRLWFATELSTVMFEDGEFLLEVDGDEVELPHPTAFVAWSSDDPDAEPPVAPEALAEGELRAAVTALEERCRAAESANAELSADSRRMGEVVAATLAEVQREREQLLDLVARTDADREREPSAQPEPSTGPEPQPRPPDEDPAGGPNQDLLARLGAARGAAGTPD